jgi:PhzF family phenazine biosynthesis protein
VCPRARGFDLRWFTPAIEVELCGHATLASAHVLWEQGLVSRQAPLSFFTKSGELIARHDTDLIELDFPALPNEPCPVPEGLTSALGVRPHGTFRSRFDLIAELGSSDEVAGAAPDFKALAALPVRGVMITARAERDKGLDFVSRFFAPGSGVDEDPVTGSAHCALAPFWAARLDKTELVGRQLSRRGGTVRIRLQGPRVRLAGRAITVLAGQLRLGI